MDVLGQDRREGLGRRSDSRISLALLILVSLILLLSSLYSAEASVFRKARESMLDGAAPVLELLSGPVAAIQDAFGSVGDYFNVLEQNKALREENAQLRQWMDEARELKATIAAYEALDVYHAPPQATPINAFVIGETSDAYTHSLIINAGGEDGVRRGQAVVDDYGLVGRIVDVGDGASRALLLTDIQSLVPVYVDGVFLDGILEGRSTDKPAIAFTRRGELGGVEAGQRVLTSGAGGVMPRGLPVGVVARVDENEAVVDLDANFVRTRMVRVLNYKFPHVEPGVDVTPVSDIPVEPGVNGPEGEGALDSSEDSQTLAVAEEEA